MVDRHDITYYKYLLEEVLRQMAEDDWYLFLDDVDLTVSIKAGERRWAQGTQGPEFEDLDVPEDEY